MKRRDVLKGAAATAVLPVGALADAMESPKPDFEKLYWEQQTHICALEEEVRELRSLHVMDFETLGHRPFYAEWNGESLSVLEYK